MQNRLFSNPRAFILILIFSVCKIAGAQSFPPYTITAYDPASTGYYFMVPLKIGVSFVPVQMILDDKGRVVYYKEFTTANTSDFKLQPNGLISYNQGAKFFLEDSTFTVVDSVSCRNGIMTDGHDLQVLPNGHFLLLGYENVTMDLSAYAMFGPNHNTYGSTNATVKCGVIQEQDANHNVVFEWHAKDHFSFANTDENFMSGPLNVDWTHCNAVEMDSDGNFLLSSRHLDEITKINRSDSSVMWHLGGLANDFTFVNDVPPQFIGQHDCRRIANGNLTLNDDGDNFNPIHPATAKEYQLDENLHTATLVWSYTENPNSFSNALGNVQRLSNGNTLVNYGQTPNENYMFNVVDPAGNKIFEITFDDTLRTYRAFNYELPWQLDRPQISCYSVGPQYYLDAGSGHSSYLWSTGATTQTIPVSAADTFFVFVPEGQGGFICSDYFVVTNTSSPCGPAAVESEMDENEFTMSPNPVADELNIRISENSNEFSQLEIFNSLGASVYAEKINPGPHEIILSLEKLPAGIYMLRLNGTMKKFVKI